MNQNFVNIITNVLSAVVGIGTVVNAYVVSHDLTTVPWWQSVVGISIAVGLYFIGKNPQTGRPA